MASDREGSFVAPVEPQEETPLAIDTTYRQAMIDAMSEATGSEVGAMRQCTSRAMEDSNARSHTNTLDRTTFVDAMDRLSNRLDYLSERLYALERQVPAAAGFHQAASWRSADSGGLTSPRGSALKRNVSRWTGLPPRGKRKSVKSVLSSDESPNKTPTAVNNPLAGADSDQLPQFQGAVAKRRGTSVLFTAEDDDAAVAGAMNLAGLPPARVSVDEEPALASTDSPKSPTAEPSRDTNATQGSRPTPAVRASGWAQSHPAMVAADVLFIVTSVAAACAPLQPVIVGYDDMQDTSRATSLAAALISQVYYFVFIATRMAMQQLDGWEIVHFREDIRRQYLHSTFRFDILLAAPVDWIFLGWATPVFFFCQLRQLLRIGRMFTLVRSLNPLEMSRKWVILMCDLAVVSVLMHASACVFMAVEGTDYNTAFYWAATTASSVGYGDVVPRDSVGSRTFAVVVMFLGLAIVAALTGIVTWLFTSKDALQEKVDEKKQMLASMMKFYDIPWDVQVEVISMVPAVLDAENGHHFKRLTEDLPSFLVEKIENYTRAKALADAIPLFSECDISVRLEVARRLVHRFHQANEPIIVAGDEGFEMFFLVRGAADVIVTLPGGDNLIVATLRAGTFFGEIALLSESVTRTASVVPVSPSEVLVLSKQNYEELADLFEDVRRVFVTVIEEAQARKQQSAKK